MKKLSNKGQSLALFVIFIPFFIIIGTYIIDLSYAKYNENKLKNTVNIVLKNGLKNIDNITKEEIEILIKENEVDIDKINVSIDGERKNIRLFLEKESKGFLGTIIGKDIYKIKASYIGYIKDEKIIIERDD